MTDAPCSPSLSLSLRCFALCPACAVAKGTLIAFLSCREDEPTRSEGRALPEDAEDWRASVRGVLRIDSRAKSMRSASFRCTCFGASAAERIREGHK